MWFFSPYPQRSLQFDFEPVIKEIDENEKQCLEQFVAEMPQEEQLKFQRKVCLHWLRTLCNKGDHCKFLHESDRERMPKCYFWQKFSNCSNIDCIYRHDRVDWHDEKCRFYVRGFCRHGNKCRRKHPLKDSICLNYLAGFCPDGPKCIFAHAKWVEEEN
jgi:cleavage and polyadenylation specificity factor subunit 4